MKHLVKRRMCRRKILTRPSLSRYLLREKPCRRFLSRHWEKSPCVVRRGASRELKKWAVDESELPDVFNRAARDQRASCLVMKDGVPVERESGSAAYVEGCSVIVNRADLVHSGVRRLCQLSRDWIPHAYCQLYCTPPKSQTVAAHADDRDVIVVQLVGKKKWRVYENVPVDYPGPKEQVGKTMPLPQDLGPYKELVLEKGDVLYLPRGTVHEAAASTRSNGSLHATLAFPTYDWSYQALFSSKNRKGIECGVLRPRLGLPSRIPELFRRRLRSMVRDRVRPHNRIQDDARIPPSKRLLAVARLPENSSRRKNVGLVARDDLSPSLQSALSSVTEKTTPVESSFSVIEDSLSRYTFAQACIEIGLLTRKKYYY